MLGKYLRWFVSSDSCWSQGIIPGGVIEVWETLPGLMISVVFATLFIGSTIPSIPKIWRLAGPQISFGWAIGWGQYVVGVLLALLVITPFFGLPPMVGALIEISFEGDRKSTRLNSS